MFTGLIRELATVKQMEDGFLTLKANYRPGIGDSIAINGACLTVVRFGDGEFTVELSSESKSILALENLKGKVHMEPAMRVSDRLEGHIVQGHIDTVGTIDQINKQEKAYDFFIHVDEKFIKYIIPKGSITIDGVSLTVNSIEKQIFRLTVIPHTMKNTLFESYQVGTRVNIETDMFARYLYHMFSKDKTLSWETIDNIMARY
ncbi:MAG: riboflavin synthase [Epsilonproteobacteria bacterium]|nr:riboflavin synthase [Campylobacterota bacterium]